MKRKPDFQNHLFRQSRKNSSFFHKSCRPQGQFNAFTYKSLLVTAFMNRRLRVESEHDAWVFSHWSPFLWVLPENSSYHGKSMNFRSRITPIPRVIRKTIIGRSDSFFSSILFISFQIVTTYSTIAQYPKSLILSVTTNKRKMTIKKIMIKNR